MIPYLVIFTLGCNSGGIVHVLSSDKGTEVLVEEYTTPPIEDTGEKVPREWVLPSDPCEDCFHPQTFYPSVNFIYDTADSSAHTIYLSDGIPIPTGLRFNFQGDRGDVCGIEFYLSTDIITEKSTSSAAESSPLSFVFEYPLAEASVIDSCSDALNPDIWGDLPANIRNTLWEAGAGGALPPVPREQLLQQLEFGEFYFNAGFYYEGPNGESLYSQGYAEGRVLDSELEIYWSADGEYRTTDPESTAPELSRGLYFLSRDGELFTPDAQLITAAKFLPENTQ
jgi:hypothetical protein